MYIRVNLWTRFSKMIHRLNWRSLKHFCYTQCVRKSSKIKFKSHTFYHISCPCEWVHSQKKYIFKSPFLWPSLSNCIFIAEYLISSQLHLSFLSFIYCTHERIITVSVCVLFEASKYFINYHNSYKSEIFFILIKYQFSIL
jgi:hypothetical protein